MRSVFALCIGLCSVCQVVAQEVQMCAAVDKTEKTGDGLSLTGDRDRLWRNLQDGELTVRFMGGTNEQRRLVERFAPMWSDWCGISFRFIDSGKSHLRVAFRSGAGSWSQIGTDALSVSDDSATMNFGWLDAGISDTRARAVILHEFGHALGMIHEHSRPDNGIPWDKDAVLRHYRETQGWDDETIMHNVLTAFTGAMANGSSGVPDRLSIMHYPVDDALTIGTFSTSWNSELSEGDKSVVYAIYPKKPLSVNVQSLVQNNGVPLSGQRWIIRAVPSETFVIIENDRAKQVLDYSSDTQSVNLQPLRAEKGVPDSGQRWYIHQVQNEDFVYIENHRERRVLDYHTTQEDCYLETLGQDGPLSAQRWFIKHVPNTDRVYLENYRAKKVLDWRK